MQVTIKGNVDCLCPMKSYSPCERGDVSRVKKELSTSDSKEKTSQYDEDEDIIVMTTKKEVVEIEISDGENAAMKSDVKSELSEAEDWIVKSEVKSEDDDFDKKKIPKVFPIKEEIVYDVKMEQEVSHCNNNLKHGSPIAEVKSEVKGDLNIDIIDEFESLDNVKLEVKKEELPKVSERNDNSSLTTHGIIRSATFIPDVSSLQQHISSAINLGITSSKGLKTFLEQSLKTYNTEAVGKACNLWPSTAVNSPALLSSPLRSFGNSSVNFRDAISRSYEGNREENTSGSKIPTLVQLATNACHEKESRVKILGNMQNVYSEPSIKNVGNIARTHSAHSEDFAEAPQDRCQQKEQKIDSNKMAILTDIVEMDSAEIPGIENHEEVPQNNIVTDSPTQEDADDYEFKENGPAVNRSQTTNQLKAIYGNASTIEQSDAQEVKENDKAADTSTDSIYYDAQSKDCLKNTSKNEDTDVNNSTQVQHDAQTGSIASSNEDNDMTYETEEEGQDGPPGSPNEYSHEANDIPLLGSDDSVHTISTTAVVEAAQVFDSDESSGNITQSTMKTSENIDVVTAKVTDSKSSPIDTSTLSSNLNSTSDCIQTSHSENTTDVCEASMKSSIKHVEDTMKPTQVIPIPPEGSIMVDCKANPLTITINIGLQDSVAAKLKQISSLAYDYTNTPKLAQDFLRADSVSIDYEKHGDGLGIKQISAEILNPSEVYNNSGHFGADNELNSSTAAVINTTSSRHTDFTTDQDSLSEDDFLGINGGKTPVDDLDLDEEDRLLQTSSPMEMKSIYPQLPSSNRKWKNVTDEDESGNRVDKNKKKIKTLGVKIKKTSGRPNFGKSA